MQNSSTGRKLNLEEQMAKTVAKISQYKLIKHKKGYNVEYDIGICFNKPVSLKKALKRIDKFVKEDLEDAMRHKLAQEEEFS
jgi:hypothetical protein